MGKVKENCATCSLVQEKLEVAKYVEWSAWLAGSRKGGTEYSRQPLPPEERVTQDWNQNSSKSSTRFLFPVSLLSLLVSSSPEPLCRRLVWYGTRPAARMAW